MELPWWGNFVCGGLAACVAEVVTLPIDTTKVRLQLLRKVHNQSTSGAPSLGMLDMMKKIAIEEGVSSLYKGFWPAIHRQLVFASLRVGIYKEIADRIRDPNTAATLQQKIFAGLLSGGIGIT